MSLEKLSAAWALSEIEGITDLIWPLISKFIICYVLYINGDFSHYFCQYRIIGTLGIVDFI